MVIRRGEIWWADLGEPRGSRPALRRPVLVVQADRFNRSGIHTIVAVALTGNLDLGAAPGNVLLPTRATHLPNDSIANVSQLVTLDRTELADRVSAVSERLMAQVDDGLRLLLDL